MKLLLLITSCIALSACTTYGSVPRYSLGYDVVPVSGYYGGGYSLYYSNGVRLRGSVFGPYGGYDPYYYGLGHATAFGYSPYYYRNYGHYGFGHSSSVAFGLGYDRLHLSSFSGGHRNGLGHGSSYRGHSVRHRRGH